MDVLNAELLMLVLVRNLYCQGIHFRAQSSAPLSLNNAVMVTCLYRTVSRRP